MVRNWGARGVGDMPFRPNPLTLFPAREGENFRLGEGLGERLTPKTLANPKPTRVGNGGVQGHSPLAGGLGDVPPRTLKRGRIAHISNHATSGTQNAGEPSANEGGQTGSRGAKPPWRGLGGVPFTPTEVSLFEKGRPAPSTGVASLRPYIEPGVEGAQPPPRGLGGCAPKN